MERRELESLARFLRERLGPEPIAGYEVGRSVLREEVMDALDCTPTQAELLVRQLERDGLIRFSAETEDAPIGGGVWQLGDRAGACRPRIPRPDCAPLGAERRGSHRPASALPADKPPRSPR